MALRIARHHHQQLGEGPVGAPELLAVEHEMIVAALGGGGEARGVRADSGLGQREGGDGARRAARQVLGLLLDGAEELERLRHPDRLVRGQHRSEVAVVAAHQLHGPAVLGHREAEAAVVARDLHPEGALPPQPGQDGRRILAALVDRRRVDVVAQERPQVGRACSATRRDSCSLVARVSGVGMGSSRPHRF